MKKVILIVLVMAALIHAAELKKVSIEEYLSSFDYQERENMKIKTPDMLALVEEG